MHGMIGYLPAISAGQVVFEYIETSFFFTQIVEGRTVCRPYRITVFSFKGSYFLEGVFPIEVHEPDVPCDGRLVVFTPRIFISLLVLV